MAEYAKVGYFKRIVAMLENTYMLPMVGVYFTDYRVGLHPWQEADQPGYASSDPVRASEQMRSALAR
jgi:hypothetical protein